MSKGRSWQAPDPAEVNSILCGQHVHYGTGQSSQSASLSVDPTHERANRSQRSITTAGPASPTQETLLERSAQVLKVNETLGPTGHLLHKATLQRLGVIEDLPNTQKQM